MGSQWQISSTCEDKEIVLLLEDRQARIVVIRSVKRGDKKLNNELASFNKSRIPDLIKWLGSLGAQPKLEI